MTPSSLPWRAALAVAALPAVLLVDAGVQRGRGWTALGTAENSLLVGLALWLAFALMFPFVPPLAHALGRRWQALTTLLVGVVLAIGTGELALALLQTPAPFHQRTPGMRRVHQTDATIMPGITGPATYTINSRGIRGPEWGEPGAQTRILCLGGSTTESLYLDDAKTWPALVSERLNARAGVKPAWVGAIALPGYSTVHHLEFLRRSPLINELDMVVMLVGINDLWKVLLGITAERQLAPPAPPLWSRLRTFGVLHALYDRVRVDLTGGLEHWAYYMPQLRLERMRARKTHALPDLAAPLDEFQARITRSVELLRARGVRPIFATQPVLWTAGQPARVEPRYWLGRTQDGSYLATRALRRGIDQYNGRLMETCRRLGMTCVDLSSMSGREEFFYDDCHLTEAGEREVARLVADALDKLEGRAGS